MKQQQMAKVFKPITAGIATGILAAGCLMSESGASTGGNSGAVPCCAPSSAKTQSLYEKPGFYTQVDKKDGRLWVFRADSEDLKTFKVKGEPVKMVTRPSAGPLGITLKSTDSETILAYVAAKPGFYVQVDKKDGRLWVFRADSEDLKTFKAKGEPVKMVTRPGAGPLGITLKSTDSETILAYVAAKPGFYVQVDKKDGRLWVFRADSEDLKAFKAKGEPVKMVTRPGAGPLGVTLKSTDSKTILEYVVAQPGFYTQIDVKDGRLWVFKQGSEDLETFKIKGEPVKMVTRPAAGPLGMTLKSTETSVLDAYQARF